VHGYTGQQARAEAARCLDCNLYCSLCVGVCPNLALQTIQVAPGGKSGVRQAYQIVVLTDWCNECGNCTTFCPTSGAPYRDKPRLYLDRNEFEAQRDNAFMVFREKGPGSSERWAMDARWAGETHHIEDIGAAGDTDPFSTEPQAAMHVLLQGLRRSMPHLPTTPSSTPPAWPAPAGKKTGPENEDRS
jgi:formate hydrogenlyase subunit 6/NADH:ubiquinone oxidoreductase subunit I